VDKRKFLKQLYAGIIIIPLSTKGSWIEENYSKIPSNKVSYNSSGVSVFVNHSASPLIYPLKEAKKVKSINIKGIFHSLPKFIKGADDQALRVGLVVEGEKKLSFLKKSFAANWVKRLYELSSANSGIDRVYFYSVTQDPSMQGVSRQHPLSDLIWENYFSIVKTPGSFNYDIKVDLPRKTIGIWIGIDGDDTKSSYQVDINNLSLEVE
jgi:hypothetical protein